MKQDDAITQLRAEIDRREAELNGLKFALSLLGGGEAPQRAVTKQKMLPAPAKPVRKPPQPKPVFGYR
jgi:hypothetical protein